MPSKLEIINRGLLKLGADRIESLSDDLEEARAAATCFDTCRDAELASAPWVFALRRALLTVAGPTPAFGFTRSLVLPVDCLRVVMLGLDFATFRSIDWVNEGRHILTEADTGLPILYVGKITDPSQFSPHFVESLACRLGAEMCERLTGSTTKVAKLDKDRDDAIAEARRVNAIQRPPQPLPDTERWLGARA